MMESIWTRDIEMPRFPKLETDTKTDVLIVGGGVSGLLCAYYLDKAGIDYILIEADRICSGVTRNTTAKITSQHGLIYDKLIGKHGAEVARLYWEANEEGLSQYRKICSDIHCDIENKDSYIYSRQHAHALDKEMAALTLLRIPGGLVQTTQLPFSIAGAIKFKDQAQFHPLKFAAAICRELRIYEHTAAKEFAPNAVLTDHCKVTAEYIILATHFPILNKHGLYPLKLYQSRSYVMALQNGQQLDGMYMDADTTGFSFRNHGDYLLVGGGSHRTGRNGNCWNALNDFRNVYYPDSSITTMWSTQDCISLDHMPYIGRYSKRTVELYVVSGLNKWGISGSIVAANVLCDMIQGRYNPYAQIFAPTRSMLHPQLFLNIWESVCGLLRPGRPRCPHLGCALVWNPYERSWDCPCHGSRFSQDGQLLDNPATGDLF